MESLEISDKKCCLSYNNLEAFILHVILHFIEEKAPTPQTVFAYENLFFLNLQKSASGDCMKGKCQPLPQNAKSYRLYSSRIYPKSEIPVGIFGSGFG